MKKEYKRIQRFVSKWQKILDLQQWNFKIQINYTECPSLPNAVATCSPDQVYKNAMIEVWRGFFDNPVKDQEEFIVHELAHCILDETNELMYRLQTGRIVTDDQRRDANEKATQHITRVIMKIKGS